MLCVLLQGQNGWPILYISLESWRTTATLSQENVKAVTQFYTRIEETCVMSQK
jgi:hypothetical protein